MKAKYDDTMNAKQKRESFQRVWEQRKQAAKNGAKGNMPDDATVLRMAEHARRASAVQEENIVPISIRRRSRWVPYAAAATLVIGVSIIGLTRHSGNDIASMPVTEEVNYNGHTIHFVCNNQCSAQDVLIAANEVIKH